MTFDSAAVGVFARSQSDEQDANVFKDTCARNNNNSRHQSTGSHRAPAPTPGCSLSLTPPPFHLLQQPPSALQHPLAALSMPTPLLPVHIMLLI